MTVIPPPSQLFVEVTSNCNLKCPHCYVEAGVGRLRQLDFETIKGVITEFRDMGGTRFTLSGGEPTLHKRWRDILAVALEFDLMAEMISNGTRLLDRDIDFLDRYPVAIDISLDAARADRHDAIRGAGSFAQTMGTLERLLARRLAARLTICFSPMRANWDELVGVFDWAESHGIGRVYVSLLEDRGRANEQVGGINLLEWQKLRLLDMIVHIKARESATTLEVPNLRYYPERLLGLQAHVDSIDRTLRMTADGDLYLTAYLDEEPFQLGHYVPGGLTTAWQSSRVERALVACKAREFLIPACRSCGIFDLCQSGSAMFAWKEECGFFGVDGYCAAKRTYAESTMRNMNHDYSTVQFVG